MPLYPLQECRNAQHPDVESGVRFGHGSISEEVLRLEWPKYIPMIPQYMNTHMYACALGTRGCDLSCFSILTPETAAASGQALKAIPRVECPVEEEHGAGLQVYQWSGFS